ncbi:MAG: AMP-binding protein [Pseudomonadota bacterium]
MANRAQALVAHAAREPGRTAVVYEGREITFGELADRVYAAAGALAARGVEQGSRVGLMMPAQPEFIVLQYALFTLGAVFAPLNILYRPAEVAHVVDCCELDYLILADHLADRRPPEGIGNTPSLSAVLPAGELLDVASGAAPVRTLASVAPQDTAMLLQTSATTGKSKGVVLTAANLAANYDRTPGWLGIGREDVIICALPLYNTFGLNQCINAMMFTGARLVILPKFDAARVIETVAQQGGTFMPAVPTMLQKIVDEPSLRAGQLASLRRIMTGGAPVPAALLGRVLAVTAADAKVLTGYGLTEASALVTLTEVNLGADGQLANGNTIGKVLDGMELAVVDQNGATLPAGASGEFIVRGPNLMAGYHRAPEDTAAALRGGWLHTGDIGYIAEDGYAYIVDRKKDVIIRGGQNIYPAEIEEAIYRVPGVAEVAVVGEPDDMLGEVAVAWVAPAQGVVLDPADLSARCREDLATFKQPAAFHIVAELPKGPTGKILRRALRGADPATGRPA